MNREEVEAKYLELIKTNTDKSLAEAYDLALLRKNEKISPEEAQKWDKRLVGLKGIQVQKEITALNGSDYKKEIQLRGRLIGFLKQLMWEEENPNVKYRYKYAILEELKKHKKLITRLKRKESKLPIPEKVGLLIKDVANSIEIFMNENDITTKAANVIRETASGSLSALLICGTGALISKLLFNLPMSLSTFVKICPVFAYIGLSSVIRNITGKTGYQNYAYQQSDEFKAIVTAFKTNHDAELKEIEALVKSKTGKKPEDIITINDQLIDRFDELANDTDVSSLKTGFQLQALSCYRENKDICEDIKNQYLNKENDDHKKYISNNMKLASINTQIFMRGNSIEEAIKHAGKSFATTAKTVIMAKAILSCIAPGTFGTFGWNEISEPLAFAAINGIVGLTTYENKLKFKETPYEGTVKANNMKRIEEILGSKRKNIPVYA